MNKLLALLLVFVLVLSGCVTTMESYSIVDPAVGCWYKNVLGMDAYVILESDHTYTEYGLGSVSGRWERDGDTIQLMTYKPSKGEYVNRSRLLYHAETDAIYYDDFAFGRVDCSSLR